MVLQTLIINMMKKAKAQTLAVISTTIPFVVFGLMMLMFGV